MLIPLAAAILAVGCGEKRGSSEGGVAKGL